MVQVGGDGVLAQRKPLVIIFARVVLLLFHVVKNKLVLVGKHKLLLDLCGFFALS